MCLQAVRKHFPALSIKAILGKYVRFFDSLMVMAAQMCTCRTQFTRYKVNGKHAFVLTCINLRVSHFIMFFLLLLYWELRKEGAALIPQ